MNPGIDVGRTVSDALEGTIEVEGEGATTMVDATVNEVALFVPVGLMLCGAVVEGTSMVGVSVM